MCGYCSSRGQRGLKALVCGRSPAGIVGSNRAGRMDACAL
jgi:hypothetical protein